MTEWEMVQLGDVALLNPRENLAKGEVAPFIAMADVGESRSGVVAVHQRPFKGGAKFRASDVLVARITPCLENGKIAAVPPTLIGVGHGSTEFVVLRGDEVHTDSRFLKYLALSSHFSDWAVAQMSGTSGRQRVNASRLADYLFSLPPLPEQRRIAGVLGALDDLIDTNERLQKKALKLVEEKFEADFGAVEINLGVGEIASVIDCLHSKKPMRQSSGRLLLQLANIRDDGLLVLDEQYFINEQDYEQWSKKLETAPFDIVVTNVGRVGALARVPENVEAALGRNMTAIRAFDEDDSEVDPVGWTVRADFWVAGCSGLCRSR